MSYVEVRRLGLSYGQFPILERVSMEVAQGALVTIVGASGCGKSTFLRMLLGQEQPTEGAIFIEGAPIAREPDPDRGIVFQKSSVFPHLTVRGNLMLPFEIERGGPFARLTGARRREARPKAEAMMERIGLAHAATRYPVQLSGGMQQRLALGQALLRRPKILLLDEPFGALDPGTRREMQALLVELWRETGLEPASLEVKTVLNGDERQNYPVADMIFQPAHLVSLVSHDMTLMPGDVIACGTSVGVGAMKEKSNTIEITIDGIGTLANVFE